MNGEWITPYIKAKPCRVRKKGLDRAVKDGWELESYLIYHAEDDVMWVAEPGYVWDGSSYPSKYSGILGRILSRLVGDRKKEGLLAASAHHDQMYTDRPMFMYHCKVRDLHSWKWNYAHGTMEEFLKSQPLTEIRLNIRSAAKLYKQMILDWPEEDQTIKHRKALKQYIGLILFQPWYRLIGGSHIEWEKVE